MAYTGKPITDTGVLRTIARAPSNGTLITVAESARSTLQDARAAELLSEVGAGAGGPPLIQPGRLSATDEMEQVFSLANCPGALGDLDQMVRQATVQNAVPGATMAGLAEQVVDIINGSKRPCARSCCSCFGRLVPDGHIQFIEHSGRTEAVTGGRWSLGFCRASWAKIATLSDPRITYGNVTVAWVQRRQIGLAWQAGAEVLLGAGLHVYNDPSFSFERCVECNTEHIQHGALHVVRVPSGSFARTWVASPLGGLQPRLLAEGLHVIDSSLFRYDGFVSAAERFISHGTLSLIRVPQGHIAKVTDDGLPVLLGPGHHRFEGAPVQLIGITALTDKVICHGTITLVRVSKGEIAVAWLNNEPLLLETPGFYAYDSPDFVYVRHQPVSDKVVALGSKKVVTVHQGEIAVSHQHGALRVLEPGRHVLEDAAHTVDGFLPSEVGGHSDLLRRLLLGRTGMRDWTGGCCAPTLATTSRHPDRILEPAISFAPVA